MTRWPASPFLALLIYKATAKKRQFEREHWNILLLHGNISGELRVITEDTNEPCSQTPDLQFSHVQVHLIVDCMNDFMEDRIDLLHLGQSLLNLDVLLRGKAQAKDAYKVFKRDRKVPPENTDGFGALQGSH
jgi:hypothetical protein